jgi:hypothetical protein
MAIKEPTAGNIEQAMEIFLSDKKYLERLSNEAWERKIRTWSAYASDIKNLACGDI